MKGYPVTNFKGITVKQVQKPLRVLSSIEQQKLSEYLFANLNSCNLGILICLYTGLRIGEICAFKWEDISLEEQSLYVHHTMQRLQTSRTGKSKTTVIISTPKSDCSIRTIPIPNDMLALLQEQKQPDNAYVLTGSSHRYMEPRTLQYRFRVIMRRCEIENVNFHVLRHTFATRCVELGFDIKSLSEILGHASVNITLNRYVHPSRELKQKNMDKLGQIFAVKSAVKIS